MEKKLLKTDNFNEQTEKTSFKSKSLNSHWVAFLEKEDIFISDLVYDNQRESPIKIIFVGCRVSNLINIKHWSWLLEGENFYLDVEYRKRGIILHYYKKPTHSLESVFKGLNEFQELSSKEVWYDDKAFKTFLTFGEILRKIYYLKKIYNVSNYRVIKRNCQHFAQDFGRILDPSFNTTSPLFNLIHNNGLALISKKRKSVDLIFPQKIQLNS